MDLSLYAVIQCLTRTPWGSLGPTSLESLRLFPRFFPSAPRKKTKHTAPCFTLQIEREHQCRTVENDIAKVLEKLSTLQQRLRDRTAGRIRGGRAPTLESVRKQCEGALHRPFLKQIITVDIKEGQGEKATPELRYQIDAGAREEIFNTYLGKNILISSHENWSNEKIIRAYRSQYQIEEVYKQMKERHCGPWWPLNHWTDQMIEVHGLYCTIAVLMRGLMMRQIQAAGINLSLGRAMKELAAIREVVNIYPAARRKKNETRQVVLSRLNKVQEKLMRALDLTPKTDV
jgi:transposase